MRLSARLPVISRGPRGTRPPYPAPLPSPPFPSTLASAVASPKDPRSTRASVSLSSIPPSPSSSLSSRDSLFPREGPASLFLRDLWAAVSGSRLGRTEQGHHRAAGASRIHSSTGGGGGGTVETAVDERGTGSMEQSRARMYPPIEPYRTGMLQVSPVHSLYWEESGNPEGQPVIFLHGGPGGGTTPANRRFFDPAFYRIVLMDQRGAGKSTPHASLEDNTTWHLVADIETLRKELKIQKWLVFGGSWGSTLSLAYAVSHPEVVLGLVLRGIFLLRKSEIIWFYQSGADTIFPEVFEQYKAFLPTEEQHDIVTAYHKRLMDDSNPDVQIAAARHWTDWEMRTSYLVPNESRIKQGEDDKFALAFARIECHYFYNKGFFSSDNFLLESVPKIRHIPCTIIQGRYDVVCPFRSAWDLHQAWPESELRVVPDAGHSANELGITSELVLATDKFKTTLQAARDK